MSQRVLPAFRKCLHHSLASVVAFCSAMAMSETSESFNYAPLSADGEANAIRIVEFQAGNNRDAISCPIKHVRLADSPQYEALSYCWGDPTPNQVVYCSGKPLAIATSLYLAL